MTSLRVNDHQPLDVLPGTPLPSAGGGNVRRRNRWIGGLSIFVVLVVAAFWIFLHLGNMARRSGSARAGGRDRGTLRAHAGTRHRSGPSVRAKSRAAGVGDATGGPAEELAAMNIPFVGEDFYNQRVLMAMNVPAPPFASCPVPPSIRARGPGDRTYRARIQYSHRGHRHFRSAHPPRARHLEAPDRRFAASHRPSSRRRSVQRSSLVAQYQDALDVVREWLGLANAWAGFPAQPGQD